MRSGYRVRRMNVSADFFAHGHAPRAPEWFQGRTHHLTDISPLCYSLRTEMMFVIAVLITVITGEEDDGVVIDPQLFDSPVTPKGPRSLPAGHTAPDRVA